MDAADDSHGPDKELIDLPLFPLNVVLFPSMVLPLRIFEERYLKMIGKCLDEKSPFGVVLIKEGNEVGGPAVPVRVGTTAKILETARTDGGQLNILTRGDKRFEIESVVQTLPYLVGRVRLLDDVSTDDCAESAEDAQGAFEIFLRDLGRLTDGVENDVLPASNPASLSYSIAQKILSLVKMPSEIPQLWLEESDVAVRLQDLTSTLGKLNESLARELASRKSDIGLN